MSTRATIVITDEWKESFYLYRHHEGCPKNVNKDIDMILELWERKGIHISDIGNFISTFIGKMFKENKTRQDYILSTNIHGDEDYIYLLKFENGKWTKKGQNDVQPI